ncbi:MAG: hypothetical protein ACRD4H_05975 [Candidatus Acidiferrales bacterium]
MRTAFIISFVLILSGIAYNKSGNNPEQVIKRMFDTGNFTGHDSKVIGPLGDAGAVFVTKILAGRDLTPKTTEMALVVIAGSFGDPSFVESPADREPRTAMLVLKYLGLSTSDPALKKEIADTTKFVQDRYARYTASLRKENNR